MPYLLIAARAMLIVVFATAFVSKARSRKAFMGFAGSLGSFGIQHSRVQLAAATMVVTAEALAVVLAAIPSTVTWGLAIGGLAITCFHLRGTARKKTRTPAQMQLLRAFHSNPGQQAHRA